MLGRNRGLHKKASTQDIREFLGVHSTVASRNSVNVFVNPLAIETPTTTYPCPCPLAHSSSERLPLLSLL